MTALLHTGVRTETVATEWSVWDTRCRLVVTDPWSLPRARRMLEQQLMAVDRVVDPRRTGSLLRHMRLAGRRGAVAALLAEALGDERSRYAGPAVHPFPYGITAAPAGALPHRPAPDRRQLALDAAALSGRAGLRLDPGTAPRAWTAQRCAEAVADATSCGVLVALGDDTATSGLAPVGGWRIELRDGPDLPATTMAIDGGAVSSISTARFGRARDARRSGSSPRRSRRTGSPGRGADRAAERGDPGRADVVGLHRVQVPTTGRTLLPEWRCVTVVAANGPAANAACVAALVRGAGAPEWLERRGLPARLVRADGRVRTVGEWPAG
jgi:hypothetical protein